jgi:hypothetical protein
VLPLHYRPASFVQPKKDDFLRFTQQISFRLPPCVIYHWLGRSGHTPGPCQIGKDTPVTRFCQTGIFPLEVKDGYMLSTLGRHSTGETRPQRAPERNSVSRTSTSDTVPWWE